MKMIVLKTEEGYVSHSIVAESYRVQDGLVKARGNIKPTAWLSDKVKGAYGDGKLEIEAPTKLFEVPISNVALIVNL